ncbi:MAG: TIGR03643 family protein [Casimicrobium sp.]
MRSQSNVADLSVADVSRIIEMAWEDRTPFEAIEHQFNVNESGVVRLMRTELKEPSFKAWRKRMSARETKHVALRSKAVSRHRASHSMQA